MRRHENLQRWRRLLRAQGAQEPDDAVRLQSVLQLVDHDDGRLRRRLPLKASDEQPRRADAQAPQRDTVFIVQRDGAAAERHGVRIQHGLDVLADGDAELLRGGRYDAQRLPQLTLRLVTEGGPGVAGGLGQGRRCIRAFLGDAVQHGAAPPAQMVVGHHADARWGKPNAVAPAQIPRQPLRLGSLRHQRPTRLQIARNGELHRQHGLDSLLRFILDRAGCGIKPAKVHAVGVEVLQVVVEFAERDRDGDRRLDIQQVEVSIRELDAPASPKA